MPSKDSREAPATEAKPGLSRRDFLAKGAVTVVAAAGSSLLLLRPASAQQGAHAKYYDSFPHRDQMEHRWAMVVDLRRCVGCRACTVACKSENSVPEGVFRTWVRYQEVGEYPNTRPRYLPLFCNHCDNPPCVPVCPVNATYKRDDGLVLIDYEKCIGCGYCIEACPYGARYLNPVQKTADKCTLCVHRLEAGQVPACVATCIGGALTVGDLNDPTSEVSQLVSRYPMQTLKPEQGTEPMFFYIGLDSRLTQEAVP
ncbi:MAG: sulfate reduction electron transfer complex DsrMKJOP subunit DsrO [Candidatus Thermoplasmatota archaeon]